MAEFAAAALTAVTAALSTAGSAASSAVSAVSSFLPGVTGAVLPAGAGGGSLFSTILQGGGSLVSAMAAVRQGDAQAKALQAQAADAQFDARSAQINGMNKDASLRRELVRALGERDAAYAASGVDLSFGTPSIARDQAIDDSNRAIASQDADTDMMAARLREKSASYLQQADEARRSGRIKAIGGVLSTAGSIARRG